MREAQQLVVSISRLLTIRRLVVNPAIGVELLVGISITTVHGALLAQLGLAATRGAPHIRELVTVCHLHRHLPRPPQRLVR